MAESLKEVLNNLQSDLGFIVQHIEHFAPGYQEQRYSELRKAWNEIEEEGRFEEEGRLIDEAPSGWRLVPREDGFDLYRNDGHWVIRVRRSFAVDGDCMLRTEYRYYGSGGLFFPPEEELDTTLTVNQRHLSPVERVDQVLHIVAREVIKTEFPEDFPSYDESNI